MSGRGAVRDGLAEARLACFGPPLSLPQVISRKTTDTIADINTTTNTNANTNTKTNTNANVDASTSTSTKSLYQYQYQYQ